MGFAVPIKHWLGNELQSFSREVLLSSRAQERGLFDLKVVERLIDEQRRDEKDNSWRLWTLLMLELWFARFID
jgi:asparagine synthase (glutamine-hydrolysing)